MLCPTLEAQPSVVCVVCVVCRGEGLQGSTPRSSLGGRWDLTGPLLAPRILAAESCLTLRLWVQPSPAQVGEREQA